MSRISRGKHLKKELCCCFTQSVLFTPRCSQLQDSSYLVAGVPEWLPRYLRSIGFRLGGRRFLSKKECFIETEWPQGPSHHVPADENHKRTPYHPVVGKADEHEQQYFKAQESFGVVLAQGLKSPRIVKEVSKCSADEQAENNLIEVIHVSHNELRAKNLGFRSCYSYCQDDVGGR